MLTDSHCHLYYDKLKNNLKEVLIRANELGVDRFICPSTNMKDVHDSLMIAREYNNIYCSAGGHPHDTNNVSEDYTSKICELMNEKLMIAVGEIGLDYFRNISSKETQKKSFREQLKIAQEIKKPVIIFQGVAIAASNISSLFIFYSLNNIIESFKMFFLAITFTFTQVIKCPFMLNK